MDEHILNQNLPEENSGIENSTAGEHPPFTAENAPPRKPGRSTGPTSKAGKARSSMNRLTHGCRSEKTIIPGEDPAEFEACRDAWFQEYAPGDDDIAYMLVDELALAYWLLKRNRKRLEDVEQRLPGNAWNWTPEHIHLYGIFYRYKRSTQRDFNEAFRSLEAHFDREHRRDRLDKVAEAKRAQVELRLLKKLEQNYGEALALDQLVVVDTTAEGAAKTAMMPTNANLKRMMAVRPNPPLVVTRFVKFLNGIPAEYDWADANALQLLTDDIGVQRLSHPNWLKAIEREEAAATGHIGPIYDMVTRI